MSKSNEAVRLAFGLGYRVTEEGNVYNPKGFKMSVNSNRNKRYPQLGFKYEGVNYTARMHRLAAYCFYGDKLFEEGLLVRHLNDDKTDLSSNNIVMGTQFDNMADISEEKLAVMSSKKRRYAISNGITPPRKLKITDEQVIEIMILIANGDSQRNIAKLYNVHHSSISYIYRKRGVIN